MRSRAARRAASPTEKLDIPVTAAESEAEDPYVPGQELRKHTPTPKANKSAGVLAAQSNGSITKKKKQKPLSRQQRLRREKGLERAEIVMDQKETAIEKSKNKGRRVQNRRAAWEELNGSAKQIAKAKLGGDAEKTDNDKDDEWEDDSGMVDVEDGEEDMPDPSAAFVGFGAALKTSQPEDEIA